MGNYVYGALIRHADEGLWYLYVPDVEDEDTGALLLKLGKTHQDAQAVFTMAIYDKGKIIPKSSITAVLQRTRAAVDELGWDTGWIKNVKAFTLGG